MVLYAPALRRAPAKAHSSGTSGLGIIPIRADNTTVFGAIDIDDYIGLNHAELAKRAARLKIPAVVCRSKSGGAHLFCLAKEPVPASLMISKLKEIAALLGHGQAEIFPKQSTVAVDRGDLGAWLNLPYFNGLLGARYAIRPENGDAMEPGEFIEYAESLRQPSEWFKTPFAPTNDLPAGPPCLQHLVTLGFPPGTRNQGLFNLGVYAKKSEPDNWQAITEDMNRKFMEPPLSADEVAIILKSLRKKDYQYRCNDQPVSAHCDRNACRMRKFGIGATKGTLELGQLAKLDTDPPIFFLTAFGQRLQLDLDSLVDSRKFQRECVRQINRFPPVLKPGDWAAAINQKLQNELEVIPAPEDASLSGQVWNCVEAFCTSRAQALSRDEVLLGKPCTEDGRTYFRSSDLQAYLKRRGITGFAASQLWALMRSHGGQHHPNKSIAGKDVNLWSIPEFKRQTEEHSVPKSITEERAQF